jgi:hypothetical protein
MFSPWYQQELCFCHRMLVGWLEGNGVRLTFFAGRSRGEEKTAPCKLLAFATEEVIMPARLKVVNQIFLVVGLIHMIVRCPKVIVSSLSVVQEGGEEIRLTFLSRSAVLNADY